MVKIAFLNIYGGRVYRGAEMAVNQIASRLREKHDVTVFQSWDEKSSPYRVEKISGVPVFPTDVSRNLLLRILKKVYLDPYSLTVLYFSLRCLPRLLSGRFDILIPINGFWQVLLCKLIKLFRGGKIIVMGYAGIGVDDWVNLKLSPDAFFAMTHVAARWAKTVNSTIHIGVVSGGVDTKRFYPSVVPMELPVKHPRVLVIAALVPYKRIDLTIRAVSLLDVSLVVAGDGPLRKYIEHFGEKLIGDRFIRIDAKFDDLPSLYTACDVFTLASMHTNSSIFEKITGKKPSEAFGIVYVEAMACGLPVVAPDDELRREIIGKAGILVDCTDIEKYAQALRKSLGRDWFDLPQRQSKLFSWDSIAKQFSDSVDLLQDSHSIA